MRHLGERRVRLRPALRPTLGRGPRPARRRNRVLDVLAIVAALAGAAALAGRGATARAQDLVDPDERALVRWLDGRQQEMERELERLVARNTGSSNAKALAHFAADLGNTLRELGFRGVLLPGLPLGVPGREDAATGPILIARRPGPPGAPTLLLNGHYDTVFEPDHPFEGVFRRDGDRVHGPGVADMKGGLVVMFEALRALEQVGALGGASFIVALNGDEELGSLSSRSTLEELASEADVGLVFEAARENGAMVSSRRGLGQFRLEVEGVAAHAGGAHADGRSAVRALASKILAIEALTDYGRGLTLNVGTIEGGTKRNVVPDRAVAWIDLRYDDPSLGEEAERALEEIARRPDLEGTSARLWGRLHRPPKLLGPAMRSLLARHAAVAEALDVSLPEPVHAGGGTDGSLFAAAGLPTLDSLGAVGGRAHTDGEFLVLPSLRERAKLAAVLILRLMREGVETASAPALPGSGGRVD